MTGSNWVSAWSSVIGSSHVAEGLPCQDNCKVETIEGTHILVAAVSDGAGSCEHSQLGSRFLVESAITLLTRLIQTQLDENNALSLQTGHWRKESFLLFKQLKADLRQYADQEQIEFKSLSATLMLTISDGSFVCCAHVGDGRAAFRDAEGNWLPMLSPTKGEEANQTLFITSDLWDADILSPYFGTYVYEESITALSLLSDGCERSSFEILKYDEQEEKYYDPNLPFKPFFEPNYANLLKMKTALFDQGQINALWEKFLTAGNQTLRHETDDKTMVLAVYTNNH